MHLSVERHVQALTSPQTYMHRGFPDVHSASLARLQGFKCLFEFCTKAIPVGCKEIAAASSLQARAQNRQAELADAYPAGGSAPLHPPAGGFASGNFRRAEGPPIWL